MDVHYLVCRVVENVLKFYLNRCKTKIPILYFKLQSNSACLVLSGYIIYYSTDVNAVVHDWVIEPVVGNRLTHQIQELTLDTTYYFKIQARNSKGMGPMSEPVQFRTPKSKCPKCAGERSTDRSERISKAYKFVVLQGSCYDFQ